MRLVIITGITGKLGEEYLGYFRKQNNSKCVSIVRRTPEKMYSNVDYLFADLLDLDVLRSELKKINFSDFDEVTLIHPIGMFKFEHSGKPEKDTNNDGIDDEIYSSNILTFTNLFGLLKSELGKVEGHPQLVVCAFGSISDQYNIPFWNSYTRSKNLLRKKIKSSVVRCKNIKVKGVFVNVSTVDTGNERNLRPHADRHYWLTPKEIVDSSVEIIEKGRRSYTEINIYKENPDFNPTWYTNHENILDRWEKQMKGEKNRDS